MNSKIDANEIGGSGGDNEGKKDFSGSKKEAGKKQNDGNPDLKDESQTPPESDEPNSSIKEGDNEGTGLQQVTKDFKRFLGCGG